MMVPDLTDEENAAFEEYEELLETVPVRDGGRSGFQAQRRSWTKRSRRNSHEKLASSAWPCFASAARGDGGMYGVVM